jgi:predicted PurR-regulated permease PerM
VFVISKADVRKLLYWMILALFMYVVYLVIKPFIVSVLTSVVIVYLFYPLYTRVNLKIKNKHLASFLVSLIIVLLVAIPGIFLLTSVSKEAYIIYTLGLQKLNVGIINCDSPGNVLCIFKEMLTTVEARYYLERALESVTGSMINWASSIALSIPSLVLNLFVVLFVGYYLFSEAPQLKKKLYSISPFHKNHLDLILNSVDNLAYSIVYGIFTLSVIEGLIGILGFTIVGASSPVLWGLIIGLLAFIPFIGPIWVWAPATIIYLNDALYWKAGLLFAMGLILSSIDTFLRPVITGSRANVNPVLILLGVLGGLNLFGFSGLILGPMILSFFVIIFNIYVTSKGEL